MYSMKARSTNKGTRKAKGQINLGQRVKEVFEWLNTLRLGRVKWFTEMDSTVGLGRKLLFCYPRSSLRS